MTTMRFSLVAIQSDRQAIAPGTLELEFQDLGYYAEDTEAPRFVPVLSGTWNLSWALTTVEEGRNLDLTEPIVWEGMTYPFDRLNLTPLSLSVSGRLWHRPGGGTPLEFHISAHYTALPGWEPAIPEQRPQQRNNLSHRRGLQRHKLRRPDLCPVCGDSGPRPSHRRADWRPDLPFTITEPQTQQPGKRYALSRLVYIGKFTGSPPQSPAPR